MLRVRDIAPLINKTNSLSIMTAEKPATFSEIFLEVTDIPDKILNRQIVDIQASLLNTEEILLRVK